MSQATEVYGQDRKEVEEKRMSESKGGVEFDVTKITGLRGKRHHRDGVRVLRVHPRQVA